LHFSNKAKPSITQTRALELKLEMQKLFNGRFYIFSTLRDQENTLTQIRTTIHILLEKNLPASKLFYERPTGEENKNYFKPEL